MRRFNPDQISISGPKVRKKLFFFMVVYDLAPTVHTPFPLSCGVTRLHRVAAREFLDKEAFVLADYPVKIEKYGVSNVGEPAYCVFGGAACRRI